MYSVVLMVAMTSSVDLPDCHKSRGGCIGGCFGGCFGGHGGGCFGGHGHHRSHGCGYAPVYNGCGCAPVYAGCDGGNGGCAGIPAGCNGGSAGTPAETPKTGNGNGEDAPLTAEEEKAYQDILKELKGKEKTELQDWWKDATNKEKRDYLKGEDEVKGPAPAKLIVKVPGSARLSIGGVATVSTSTERSFVSPVLVPGQSYYYTVQATFEQAGKSVVVTREVEVRAGKTTQVHLGAARTIQAVVRR